MIGRRAVLLAGAGLAAWPARAVVPPPPRDLSFRLMRYGSEIGRHTVQFAQTGDELRVRVAVEARVTLLSIPIAHYQHHAEEIWRGGRLVGLTGTTIKNGDHEWVGATRNAGGLHVMGSKTLPYVAPEPAMATSYWNKGMVRGPLVSLEDGVLLRPKVALHAAAPVKLASGSMIAADKYSLSGPFCADVWYDLTDTWAALALPVPDGSLVHYERL